MKPDSKILVAGAAGLVGSAIHRRLQMGGYENILVPTRLDIDFTDQQGVKEYFSEMRPEYVFMAAARVGGILANSTQPALFIHDNLSIQTNVIHSAYSIGTKKLLFLGSSCIYPKLCPQPISEESLLSGPLETTNEWYAIAKIAGIKLCQAYAKQYSFNAINLMPTNLYGPGDNFDPDTSHVLPALIRRFHEAKELNQPEVVVWGTGTPRREFLHVDDLADACLYLMREYNSPDIINVGTGKDISISELAYLTREIIGYEGTISFDPSKPDGTPRKLLDTSRLTQCGWHPRIPLRLGIELTYSWYLNNKQSIRK